MRDVENSDAPGTQKSVRDVSEPLELKSFWTPEVLSESENGDDMGDYWILA